MLKIFKGIFLIGITQVFVASVTIYNDSPFTLTATILSADGKNMGSMTIVPQHQMKWQDSYQGGATFSESPYTAIFTCPSGKEYGIWDNIPSGGFINAQSAVGDRVCRIPKPGESGRNANPYAAKEFAAPGDVAERDNATQSKTDTEEKKEAAT